jgi:hypothetical protein
MDDMLTCSKGHVQRFKTQPGCDNDYCCTGSGSVPHDSAPMQTLQMFPAAMLLPVTVMTLGMFLASMLLLLPVALLLPALTIWPLFRAIMPFTTSLVSTTTDRKLVSIMVFASCRTATTSRHD